MKKLLPYILISSQVDAFILHQIYSMFYTTYVLIMLISTCYTGSPTLHMLKHESPRS